MSLPSPYRVPYLYPTLDGACPFPRSYDRAWPIVSNVQAVRVNQMYAGDAGRLVAIGELGPSQDLYHGAGCECVYQDRLPRWAVFAKRLDGGAGDAGSAEDASEAAAIAINFSNDTLPAAHVVAQLSDIFGDASPNAEGATDTRMAWKAIETEVWSGQVRELDWGAGAWQVPPLAARSSFFVTIKRTNG